MRPRVDIHTETFKWLAGLGVPGFEKCDWYTESGRYGNKVLHADRNCRALADPLKTVKRSRLDFAKSVYTMCSRCGYDFLDTGSNRTGIGCALGLYKIYQQSLSIVGSQMSEICRTPALHALLVRHIVGNLQNEIDQLGNIPAILQVAKTVAQTGIEHTKIRYCLSQDEEAVTRLAWQEAVLLGRKDETRWVVQEMNYEYVLESQQQAIARLLDKWLLAIDTVPDADRASELCKASEGAKALVKHTPDINNIIDVWEQTFYKMVAQPAEPVFFTTTLRGAWGIDGANCLAEALNVLGTKISNRGHGLGELPATTVSWLGRIQGPKRQVRAVTCAHQQLTGTQWEMALALWDEAGGNDDMVYRDAGAAIAAAIELSR